jgi:hypothetical protein
LPKPTEVAVQFVRTRLSALTPDVLVRVVLLLGVASAGLASVRGF